MIPTFTMKSKCFTLAPKALGYLFLDYLNISLFSSCLLHSAPSAFFTFLNIPNSYICQVTCTSQKAPHWSLHGWFVLMLRNLKITPSKWTFLIIKIMYLSNHSVLSLLLYFLHNSYLYYFLLLNYLCVFIFLPIKIKFQKNRDPSICCSPYSQCTELCSLNRADTQEIVVECLWNKSTMAIIYWLLKIWKV